MEIWEIIQRNINENSFKNNICRKIFYKLKKQIDNGDQVDIIELMLILEDQEVNKMVLEIIGKKVNRKNIKEQVIETIQRILDREYYDEKEELRKQIQSGELNDNEAVKLIERFEELKYIPPKVKI